MNVIYKYSLSLQQNYATIKYYDYDSDTRFFGFFR